MHDKSPIGLSIDGLTDAFFPSEEENHLYMSDVVFLDEGRHILTMAEAESTRQASGFSWPPEAAVDSKSFAIKRLPISWAWRLLIDCESSPVSWISGEHSKVQIEQALAAHIAAYLRAKNIKNAILAIPDGLNDYGQEWLLRALKRTALGMRPDALQLLWRPIAATLSLLDSSNFEVSTIRDAGDYVLVVHFGPDALEITTASIRIRIDNEGQKYAVPLRNKLLSKVELSGCDLAGKWLENKLGSRLDFSGWWQGFTGFSETWSGLCDEDLQLANECVPWWREELGWQSWTVGSEEFDDILNISAERPRYLEKLKGKPIPTQGNWGEYLLNAVKDVLDNHKTKGRLCGLVFSGRLISKRLPKLINDFVLERLSNEEIHPLVRTKQHILAYQNKVDIVANGAFLYGERLHNDKVGYLDIVEQIYVWAFGPEGMQWFPLLDEPCEVKGGAQVQSISRAQFTLKAGSKELTLFLRKGKEENEFRKAITTFPFSPINDIRLRVHTSISTASGFAHIEFIPDDTSFLSGERVFFNFEKMEVAAADELPKPGKGYQDELMVISASDNTDLWRSNQWRIDEFLQMKISNRGYLNALKHIRKIFCGSPRSRTLNQDGQAANSVLQQVMTCVVIKLGSDFEKVLKVADSRAALHSSLITTSRWLYSSTPTPIYNHLISQIDLGVSSSKEIRVSGICISKPCDIRKYLERGAKELKAERSRAVVSAWLFGLFQILCLRPDIENLLTEKQADTFIRAAFWEIKRLVSEGSIKQKFLETLGLVQGVLRYRKVSNSFPDDALRRDLDLLLDQAKLVLNAKPSGVLRIREALEKTIPSVQGYINYHGSGNVLEIIKEAIEQGEEEEKED